LVYNWGCGGRNRAITVPLESPSHVGIVRLGGKVGTGIAVGTVWPSLALIDDGTVGFVGDKDRNLIPSLVGCADTVWLGTTISYLIERAEVGRASGGDSSLAVTNKFPSHVIFVGRLVLVAPFRIVDVTAALIDNRVVGSDRDRHLV
jgi:hypothetical protein